MKTVKPEKVTRPNGPCHTLITEVELAQIAATLIAGHVYNGMARNPMTQEEAVHFAFELYLEARRVLTNEWLQ